MNNILRVIVTFPGLFFAGTGIQWLMNPEAAGATIGLPMLEGMALSSQMGDTGSFFMATGVMILLGVATLNRVWFLAPAMLVGGAAIFRIVAWSLHGAALPIEVIVFEAVIAALLVFASTKANP